MPPKRGGMKGKDTTAADAAAKLVAESLKVTERKEEISSVPQREIVLGNLVTYTDELSEEDRYRRKKLVIFVVVFLLSLLGIVISLYSMHETVLFQELPLNWTYFGVSCIFYVPCISWFFWLVCARYDKFNLHCCTVRNYCCLKEHSYRKTLKAQRADRAHVARMQKLYLEGDIDPPQEALEPADLPYEYDPTQPWAYIRWKPKPPIKVRFDEEGIAWIVTPEEQAAEEAARIAALSSSEGKDGGQRGGLGYDDDDDDGVPRRKSSVIPGKKKSVQTV